MHCLVNKWKAPVKNACTDKSYQLTQEPLLPNTFPILTTWLEKRKKLWAQEFLIATWINFKGPHFKS